MGLGDSLRRAAVDADQSAQRMEEKRRLEKQKLILAEALLEKLGRDAADELRARSAPLTLVADTTFRRWEKDHSWYNARLAAVSKVWCLGSFAITQEGHIHVPGRNGVFTLANRDSSEAHRKAGEKATAFAWQHGCETIMGPLRERVTPAAHRETGEWAVDRFYAEDGVLMYGGGPAEDVFAKLIVEMTA